MHNLCFNMDKNKKNFINQNNFIQHLTSKTNDRVSTGKHGCNESFTHVPTLPQHPPTIPGFNFELDFVH